ncbi:MAG TPA: hypothetical protein VJ943_03445 [Desulfotignum sp.]|nr:hypothetical protein [Desulfotignum sp.]
MLGFARQGMPSLRQKNHWSATPIGYYKEIVLSGQKKLFCISAVLSACAVDLCQKTSFFAVICGNKFRIGFWRAV